MPGRGYEWLAEVAHFENPGIDRQSLELPSRRGADQARRDSIPCEIQVIDA